MESDNRNCQESESDDGTSDSTALVRSFDWLVSSTLKYKPDIEDVFAELFQEKYLFIKINKNNV